MIIGDRIQAQIAIIGTTQAELARAIKVTPQAISKLVRGGTTDTAKLYQIAKFLGTTPEYLIGEIDDPKGAPTNGSLQSTSMKEAERSDLVAVDEIDLRFGLGGTYIDGPVQSGQRLFSREWLRNFTRAAPEHLFWAMGDGDSMEPTIRSGEVILIDRSQVTPAMGDGVWACAYGQVGMVKRLRPLPNGTIEVLSDNRVVPPTIATDGELHVIGRVVAVVRKL